MFFGREHVAKPNSHHCSAAQFGLRKISASGSIDSLHEFAVQFIEPIDGAGAPSRRWAWPRRGRRCSNKSKTNHTHIDRRGDLEAMVASDHIGEQVCQAD